MQNQLEILDLGSFTIGLPPMWDAHFFPRIESKVRLVKDETIVMIEYFLVPEAHSESFIDVFYEDHILDLQRNINGVIFEDEEDTDYEILFENDGEFRRYFFCGSSRYILRFTMSGLWEPEDEDEIRSMLKNLTINAEPTESTEAIIPVSFDFDYQDWFKLGAMYSRRGGL